ncbi:uncharacterized protein LOC116345405 [Contarinia nasturtii]|uniref:uncharacterized protein LOC116345405 n=1 Tax=Contarinia nasturtii TaxID=265458 RepID=UPI0012D3EF7B|nr:uncharacterized protein LOC116345405 [Contarinia nasturtii]
MSSTDDKTDSGSKNKLDIEAFRHHLLNYRTKADDSESDLYQFDLDSSFKRMLDEKRQATNKENNPPSTEPSTSSTNPPEKPMRKDLMKERLRSRIDDSYMDQSYMMEYSVGSEMEFSTINRLMADFNINRDSSVCQKRSPLKMLKITGDSLNENGFSYQIQRSENSTDATNQPRNQATNDLAATASANIADDTLEEIEYVLDRGLNYVPKRLINEIKQTPKDGLEKCENQTDEMKTYENDENQENNENQENIENDVEKKINTFSDYKTEGNFYEDEIIVLDSSPETSFATTQNTECFKSAFESNETTYHTAKSDLNNVSVVSIDSDSDSAINESMNKSEIENSNQMIAQDSGEGSLELNASVQNDVTSSSDKYGDMPNFNDTLERVEYMMEQGRMMMLDKNARNTPIQNVKSQNAQKKTPISQTKKTPISQTKKTPISHTKKTPVSQTKSKVLTPSSSSAKKTGNAGGVKHFTPNNADLFKRPDQRTVRSPFGAKSASASKAHAPPQHSRIPMKTSSLQKPQFRHIASPIAAYINNTPEVPLIKTVRPARNLHMEDFNKMYPSTSSLDESTQSVEILPMKSALPRKMYISAPQRKIIDQRHMVTPGGQSVQKLIGPAPLVIRHDGKVKSQQNQGRAVAQMFEDSLADLSIASGDISVQVVQDVHRKN